MESKRKIESPRWLIFIMLQPLSKTRKPTELNMEGLDTHK